MEITACLTVALLCLSTLSTAHAESQGSDQGSRHEEENGNSTSIQNMMRDEERTERGDGMPIEPEPTSPVTDADSTYNYVLSRLAAMDQAIHRLNVGHYTLDVKVNQLLERITRLDTKLSEVDDSLQQVAQFSKENRKEIGRLEGCQKGRSVGYKCFLVYRAHETYDGAAQKCLERGGRLAMPRDRREQEALAEYVHAVFKPGNWPLWLGVNDLRSEGMYLYEDTTRVTYFQWRKHFLSSQPDGGKRENCVSMSSDDGDWWDSYCDRRMYYLCEFEA
ncbi:C-type lectin domain family 11 member A [Engraulis encrasicolus]|uniref:C-type lectin domain family 11 member A n=1 Tax=Engraulis encrasicolus TaxID=184585 RepID=UPI002FCF6284